MEESPQHTVKLNQPPQMTYRKHITLGRSDLKSQFSKLPVEMISTGDFMYPEDRVENADTIIFRDAGAGHRTIVLKDVHGIFSHDIDGHILYGLMLMYATTYPRYRVFVEMIVGKQLTWKEEL